MNWMGLLIVGMGLFSICGAAFNWDWFMNARKARFMVSVFGRTGARIFYCGLGCLCMVLGVLMLVGVIRDTQ